MAALERWMQGQFEERRIELVRGEAFFEVAKDPSRPFIVSTEFAIAKALGDAGINLGFVLAQVVGRKYAAVLGFENDADAAKAIAIIRKAAAPARKR